MLTRRVQQLIVATIAAASIMPTQVAAAPVDGSATANATAVRLGNATSTEPPPAPPSATYRVTVSSDWSAASHPSTLPSNSHFSPPVVVAHGERGDLFEAGTLASPGIESMAETGSTGTLRAELASDPTVISVQTGTSIFGPGTRTFTVTLSQGAPLVSVVTMLAPSPDWFIGREVSTFVDDAWVQRVVVVLNPYDSGTDSGSGFQSPNADTNPAQLISGPRDAAFQQAAAEGAFGHIVVERI